MNLFVPFVPAWLAGGPPALSTLLLIKGGIVLALAIYVQRSHKPWPATVILVAFLVYLDYHAHRTPAAILLRGLISLAIGGALFWAIDRSSHLVLTIGLALAGGAVVLYLL